MIAYTGAIPGSNKHPPGDYAGAAQYWLNFGFSVIPLIPGTKKTAVKWDSWLAGLSPVRVAGHWAEHPDHEVGCIVGEGFIVFDADSPASIAALAQLEEVFEIAPCLVVKTKKGVHHYYGRVPGAFAKSDAHSTDEHPDRIDIKTGRAMVVLPPSTGKEVDILETENASGLSVIGQDVIDAVFRHNGRDAPRPPTDVQVKRADFMPSSELLARLKALTDRIHRYGYHDWFTVVAALHHETGGGAEGLDLADDWSSRGRGYKGRSDVEALWRSLGKHTGDTYTISTLAYMVNQEGDDWLDVCDSVEPPFERCEFSAMESTVPATLDFATTSNPLAKYSLRGMGDEIRKMAVAEVHVLGELALQGQATVLYSAANTGKTLITLNLLTESIRVGRINADKLYYLNVDDTVQGLITKQAIADEFGFHMIAEGWRDFTVSAFLADLKDMIDNDTAHGVIIVLDTLKKFTNLMDKGKSSHFAKFVRQFVLKGGTLIALAHTNKNPRSDGKPQYSGTSDIVDDFDCAYTLRVVSHSVETGDKVVEFENFKRRGNVAPVASYSYTLARNASYLELLLSVKPVDEQSLELIKKAEEVKTDAEVIKVVLACIAEGINTKMTLAREVKQRSGISNKAALQVIEKYTGDDPGQHWWTFEVGARGAQIFTVLARPSPDGAEDSGAVTG